MNESKNIGGFVDETSQSSLPSASHFVTPERDSLSRLFDDDLTTSSAAAGTSSSSSSQQDPSSRRSNDQQPQMWKEVPRVRFKNPLFRTIRHISCLVRKAQSVFSLWLSSGPTNQCSLEVHLWQRPVFNLRCQKLYPQSGNKWISLKASQLKTHL